MYDQLKDTLKEFEVIIHLWPEYMSVLENAIAEVEKAVIEALEKYYTDILDSLKDRMITKKYGLKYVQKIAKLHSFNSYTVPDEMLETKTVLYPEKRIGHIPGIDVGQQFFSRAEMVVVGLHSHWLNGIDFMGVSYGRMEKYKGKKFPLAVCIELSGIYKDSDNLEDLTYTGQGGHDLNNKKQIGDQKMKRGNLALKVPFGYSRKDVLLIGLGVTLLGYGLKR